MKKIIAISLLCALLIIAVSACGEHECTFADTWTYDDASHWHAATCEHTDKTSGLAKHSFDANGTCLCGATDAQRFVKALANTNPMTAQLTLKETTNFDGITLNGLYNATFPGDGTVQVIYEIEQFDETFVSETPVTTVSGIVIVNADGTISGDNGLNKGIHIALLLNIDLTNPKINAKVSNNNIRFTVAKADTAAILGVAVDSDVTVGINISNGKVLSIDVTYANPVVTALYA